MKIKTLHVKGFYKVLSVEGLPFDAYGFLAIKSLKSGICTGGLRITDNVYLEEVLSLAVSMELKFKLHDLPVGGAKSGICIPTVLSSHKKNIIIQNFAKAIKEELQDCYLTGPDLGSSSQDIDLVYRSIDENQMILSKKLLSKTPMKSLLFFIPNYILKYIPTGYSSYGSELTGRGLVTSLKSCVDILLKKKICIHGAGQVAQGVLKSLINENVLIMGICDIKQGVVFSEGLSPKKVITLIKNNLLFKQIDLNVDSRGILFLDVDILILASHSHIISTKDIGDIKARTILEGANNTMSPEIDDLLYSKGIKVIPDFSSNSAISVSFGLMITNQVNPYFKSMMINQTVSFMEKTMKKANSNSKKNKISLREYFFKSMDDDSIDYLKNVKSL